MCGSVQLILSCPTLWNPMDYGKHARLACLSPTPRAYSNSCPLSRWCFPTISSSVVSFSSCLQSFPASVSFPMSQFFTSGSQSTRASASASVLPKNIQDWFPLGLHGLISLQPKGLSRVFSKITVQKQQFYDAQLSKHLVQFSHPLMNTGKTIAFTRWIFVGEVLFLVCNMLPRLVIAFLPRSKCLLISWLQSPSAVILEPPQIVCHYLHCFPIYFPWSDRTRCHDLSFLNADF